MAASLVLTIILRMCLMLENRRRDHLSQEKYDHEAAIKEPCDWVSSYLIFLISFYHCSLVASSSTIRFVTCQHRLVANKMNLFSNQMFLQLTLKLSNNKLMSSYERILQLILLEVTHHIRSIMSAVTSE